MSVLSTILDIFRFNRRNWKVVVLCILAATIFWLFNALNKTYTTNITFPLEFDYDKETFVAVQPLPSNVRINVKGIGWDLFRRSAGLKVPALSIPLERPSEIKKIVATARIKTGNLKTPKLRRNIICYRLNNSCSNSKGRKLIHTTFNCFTRRIIFLLNKIDRIPIPFRCPFSRLSCMVKVGRAFLCSSAL